MLMLTRRTGETIRIGDVPVTVGSINEINVVLWVNGKKLYLPLHKSAEVMNDVTIMLSRSSKYQVRLGIKAPENVKILREELYIKQENAA